MDEKGIDHISDDSCLVQFFSNSLLALTSLNNNRFLRCNKAYISASGLRTHWKTTSCRPSPAEEAMTAEKSSFVSEVEAAAAALLQHKHAHDHGELRFRVVQ